MKKQLISRILIDILLVVLVLMIVVVLHECAHCITARYYGLESEFHITSKAIGPVVKYSTDEFINRVVNISGLIVNIIVAVISILILFILQVYLPKKNNIITIFKNHIDLRLFLLIFALANILLTLFLLILYPYTGIL